MFFNRDINDEKQKENQKIDKLKVKTNNIVVGDLVQYKIEKRTFTKGYTITNSNDIHRVVSVSHHKVILDNRKEYKFENLQNVPVG